MTAEELRRAATTLFGEHPGWQSRLARALKVQRSAVSRWIAGMTPIPGPVEAAVACWLAHGPPEPAPGPGQGEDGEEA